VNRSWTLLVACCIASMLASGCAKSSSSDSGAAAQASGPVAGSNSSGDVKKGATIFAADCASCHGAAGAGGGIGPVLIGEKGRKDYSAALAWIKNPQPPMPKLFPATLSETDVEDVASYVESL